MFIYKYIYHAQRQGESYRGTSPMRNRPPHWDPLGP